MPGNLPLGGRWNNKIGFAIASVVLAKKAGIEVPHTPGNDFVVSLTINGVEVPYAETIEEIYGRFQADLDRRAAEIAHEKLTGSKVVELMSKVQDALTEVDWCIRDAIEKDFGVKLRED